MTAKGENMEDLMPRIQTIFQDVFDDPKLHVGEETTASDVPGWDSLSTINVVFALEREFGVRFALGEIQELSNVGAMAALIGRKRAASGE